MKVGCGALLEGCGAVRVRTGAAEVLDGLGDTLDGGSRACGVLVGLGLPCLTTVGVVGTNTTRAFDVCLTSCSCVRSPIPVECST